MAQQLLDVLSPSWLASRQPQRLLRMRDKTASLTIQELSCGQYARDEMIQVGPYHSNPCQHPLRMASALWQGTWSRYLTRVLDPQGWSARAGLRKVSAALAP